MAVFQLVLVLLLASAALTTLAKRIGAPYPALLAVAGSALAFVPTTATAQLDPELALALFVAPTLLDAAYDASPRDLRANALPVLSLVLVAVCITVAAVALAARWMVPAMSWPVAIVLGAIVAPPDASAATAVLRALRPPHRVMVILEGESLLNDASALLIYRVALGVATGGALSFGGITWMLLLTWAGGALFGWAAARFYMLLVNASRYIGVSVVMQFVGTFAVWIAAERLDVSPVLTTVAYATTLARFSPGRMGSEHRRASYAVWEVAVYVLNALAFILIGLQLKGVLSRLDGHAALTLGFAGTILLVAVGARMAWVLGITTLLRHVPLPPSIIPTQPGPALLIAWCGMRGIVTLATALALPPDFPFRDLLVAAAYAVVLGTLVGQGLTLYPLMRALRLPPDESSAEELAAAREAIGAIARARLSGEPALLQVLEPGAHRTLLDTIIAQRTHLLELRRNRTIGDDTFHLIEEELDWAEGHSLRRLRAAPPP